MMGTIQSSWEFIDYVFLISDVTRAFTHQLVRHRVGTSFAQQAQRAVDMTGFGYEMGPSIAGDPQREAVVNEVIDGINAGYKCLTDLGADKQDARGILPTNVHTNIVFKANLRTLHDMGLKRLCVKAQGEFQDVFREIRARVVEVHPWAEPMIRVQCAWNGTCLFPSLPLDQCPVKPFVYDPARGSAYNNKAPMTTDEIQQLHQLRRAQVQPLVPR